MILTPFSKFSNRFRAIIPKKLNVLHGYCTKTALKEYIPVYKFPYVRACGIINQLKFYQTALTTTAIPSSLILNHFGFINNEVVLLTCAIGISGTLSLFLLGFFPYKLVGFVYIKEDNTTMKISYLDFWGRRKDKIMPIADLVPLSDLPAIPTDPLYLTMRRFSCPETFKINLKFGIVLEKDKFKNVFLQDVK